MISYRSKNERKKKKEEEEEEKGAALLRGGTINTPGIIDKKRKWLYSIFKLENFMRRYRECVIQRNSRLMSFGLAPLSPSLSFTIYQDADLETGSERRQAAVNKGSRGWYEPSAIRCLKLIVPLSGLGNNFRARSNGGREQPDYGNGISSRDINTFDTVPLYIRLIRPGKNFSTPTHSYPRLKEKRSLNWSCLRELSWEVGATHGNSSRLSQVEIGFAWKTSKISR